ncbi:MAG TPA: FtsX-like permease family protein, partial [Chitinophagaceae bacterium]|nr:FtsX-like permease family protein [Chitinophagaceae bacterium]
KSLYSEFYTDLKIVPATGKNFTLTAAQLQQLKGINGIRNFSLIAEEKALIQNGQYQSVVFLKGVDENYRYTTGVSSFLVNHAEYDIGNSESPKLIVGEGVENALGIRADANIFLLNVYLPRKSNTELLNAYEDISSDTVRTSAAFKIQQDFDNKYCITNIDFVKRALKFAADEYTGVEIAVNEKADPDVLKNEIRKILGAGYLVLNKYEQNKGLYSVMSVERWFVYGILCLILVVAAFTMIGALTMLVLEKQKDISVLQSLGAGKKLIQKIFLTEGMLLAIIGGVVGMLLALGIVILQMKTHFIPLTGGSFLIDYFPVKLRLFDFLLVSVTVFVIAFIAAWIPSKKAASQNFSLRSE